VKLKGAQAKAYAKGAQKAAASMAALAAKQSAGPSAAEARAIGKANKALAATPYVKAKIKAASDLEKRIKAEKAKSDDAARREAKKTGKPVKYKPNPFKTNELPGEAAGFQRGKDKRAANRGDYKDAFDQQAADSPLARFNAAQ